MKKLLMLFALILLASALNVRADHKPYTRNVAIVLYENAEPLDWVGPFEVYNDAARFGSVGDQPAFNVYIVSKTTDALNAQGLHVVPSYSIANAPKPDIVVFPGGPSNKIYDDPVFFAWASKASIDAEIAQSVCTGAFVLARAGLLDGLDVTTFHGAIEDLRNDYPKAHVQDGRRFIDNGHVVTTAGISAGIDGSLNVIARLLGRRIADQVATYMEYHWTPEAYLATKYAYLNPSTDARGRLLQTADMQHDEKDFAASASTYRAVLKVAPEDAAAWYGIGENLRDISDHAGAADAFISAAHGFKGPATAYSLVDAAREYVAAQNNTLALQTLKKAFDAGYPNRNIVNTNPAFARLRDDPRLKEIVATK